VGKKPHCTSDNTVESGNKPGTLVPVRPIREEPVRQSLPPVHSLRGEGAARRFPDWVLDKGIPRIPALPPQGKVV